MSIDELLQLMESKEASDLHLKPGAAPVLRVYGKLLPVDPNTPLTSDQINAAFEALTNDLQRAQFAEIHELDFSYQAGSNARFRINACLQQGAISLSLRRIALEIPGIDELGLPSICKQLVEKHQGLVLITGPTGSGKSTTLAAMIEHLNQSYAKRIITIEDPIEYVYQDKQSFITQRELGRDTNSFAIAARQSLRQDPDVILVGEMRDPETISACLTAAETGHLVMSTLHTNNAPQTVDRIVDSFPPHQQGQIRMQLSLALLAVLSQALLPRQDGGGRVVSIEIMLATSAIRNLIREGKTHQMLGVIQTGLQHGMRTMEQSLADLYQNGMIDLATAMEYANEPENLRSLIGAG